MKRLKGLHTDGDPIDQPPETYRDAENAVLNEKLGAISSEQGNVLRDSIPTGFSVIGDALIYDGSVVIFSTDDTDSEIGTFDGSTYTTILNEQDLNFSTSDPIEAKVSINEDSEAVVYWTDGVNPPRKLNIDSVPSYTSVDEFNIFGHLSSGPSFSLDSINESGGSLKTGSYIFAIAYRNEGEDLTDFTGITHPVYIIDDSQSDPENEIDGATAGTPTSKSISLTLEDLDTSYDYLQVAVIRKENGTLTTPILLPERSVSSSVSFTYTGNETFTETSLDDIVIPSTVYETAQTLNLLDDILYMGNLTKKPDIGYQKFANNIKVEALTTGMTLGDYKDPVIASEFKGFQRDAVYAFYVSFILKNGQETRAYHIPGRASEETEADVVSDSDQQDVDDTAKEFHFDGSPDATYNMAYWENENEDYPDTDDFDVYDVDANGDPVDPGGGSLGDTTLRNTPVRHHHFPEAQHEPFFEGGGSSGAANIMAFRLQDLKIPNTIVDDIAAVKVYYAKRTPENNVILDQTLDIPGHVQTKDGESVIENNLPPIDTSTSPSTDNIAALPFRLMRTRESIGSLTHIKTIGRLDGGRTAGPTDAVNTFKMGLLSGVTDEVLIRGVEAKAYAESHIDIVELTDKGFSEDGRTFKSSSKIFMELVTGLEHNIDTNTSAFWEYLMNLCSLKKDIYNSFDAQELVFTGYIDSNIARYDPTQSYTPTGGSSGDGGTAADGVTTVQNAPSETTGIVVRYPREDVGNFTSHETAVNFDGTEDIDAVMTKIVNAVNGDSNAHITAEANTPSPDQITFTVKETGAIYNETQVMIDDDSDDSDDPTWADPPWNGNTGPVEVNPVHMDGGSDTTGGEDDADKFETLNIYGGDVFINAYGVRVTQEDNEGKILFHFPCESRDNIGFRHQGENFGESYYPKDDETVILDYEEDDSESNDDVWYDNVYNYNPDYSAQADIRTAIPFSKNLSERTKYPTRVIRLSKNSKGAFSQALDADFVDLTGNRGELIKLSVLENVLIPHMERSLIRTKGREELVTGDLRTFIGAGDIFSVKPDELSSTKAGLAGCIDPLSAITTPYGYFFVDRKAHKVFLVGAQDSPVISEKGLRNFFEDELSGVSSDNQLIATWDDKWDRIILTYKENWTLSYYPQLKAWGSFHSYDPDYYFHDLNTFYSVNGINLYEHNIEDVPGKFYGTVEDFIFEFVDNRSPAQTKQAVNIELITEVRDSSGNYYDETFNEFRVTNRYQDSGDRTITVHSSLGDGSNARNIRGKWRINKFRDLIDDSGNIDTNKAWHEQGRFLGNYLKVKLVYNNSANKSLYLFDSNVNFKRSNR